MDKRILFVPLLAMVAFMGIMSTNSAQAQTPGTDTGQPKTAPSSPDCPPAWRVVSGARAFNQGGQVLSAVASDDIWLLGDNGINHWNGSSWTIVTPNPDPAPGHQYLFFGLAAHTHNDVWFAGYVTVGGLELEPFTVHYDGTTWRAVPTAYTGHQPILQSIAPVSPNDVWFVGYFFDFNYPHALIMHYDGTSVSQVPSPDISTGFVYLSDIEALSSNDVWTVGYYTDPNDFLVTYTLTEHWNGSSWSIVPSPNIIGDTNLLSSVSAVPSNDSSEGRHSEVWAVGSTCNQFDCFDGLYQPLAMHYDGRAWSPVPTPNLGPNYGGLSGVAAISRNDAWVVGTSFDTSGNTQALTEHWNGHAWSVVSSPSPNPGSDSLTGISLTSRDDGDREGSHKEVWAAGTFVERYSNRCR